MAQFAALYNVNIGSGSSPVPPTPDPTPVYFDDNLKTVSIYDTDGNLVNKVVGNPGDEVLIATDTSTYYGPVQITRTQGTVDTSVYLSTLTMPKYDIDVVKDPWVTSEYGWTVNVRATTVLSSANQTVTFDQLGWKSQSNQCKIIWDDGNTDTGLSATTVSHTYTDAGTYIIQIMGLISYDFSYFSAIGYVTKLELASESVQTDFKVGLSGSLKSLIVTGTKTRLLQYSTTSHVGSSTLKFVAFANVSNDLFTDGSTSTALIGSGSNVKNLIYPYGYNGIVLLPSNSFSLDKLILPTGFSGTVNKQDFYGRVLYCGAKTGPCNIGTFPQTLQIRNGSGTTIYKRTSFNPNIEEIYGDGTIYLATGTTSDDNAIRFPTSYVVSSSIQAYDSSAIFSDNNHLRVIDAPDGVGMANNYTDCNTLPGCANIDIQNWVYKPHATLNKSSGTANTMIYFQGAMPKAYDLTEIHSTASWTNLAQNFDSAVNNPQFHIVCATADQSKWNNWLLNSYRYLLTTDTSYLN